MTEESEAGSVGTVETNGSGEEIFLDIAHFNESIVGAFNDGSAELGLDADIQVSRSLVPAGTGAYRDFSYIAPDIPELIYEKCVGCMDCVTQCPDTAILGVAVSEKELDARLAQIEDEAQRESIRVLFTDAVKFSKLAKKNDAAPPKFGIFIDPTKCKGCGECVEVCGSHASLRMIPKTKENMEEVKRSWSFYKELPSTPKEYINEKFLADM
ncbi:MAG: 4Fe-4S binding protein, partial [bacterium]